MFEVFLVLTLTALSTNLLGSLLVLTDQTMLVDALSHSVLLGIVLGFFWSKNLGSPLLVLGAALFGVVTVLLIERIQSKRLAQDAATGFVFSLLFSVAVLLISLFLRNVHLDLDMVLMGEVLFAPFYRIKVLGVSISVALIKIFIILMINLGYLSLFYQPLKLMLFDKVQSHLQGIPVNLFRLMTLVLVSLTTVVAFDVVGSITVIVLMVAPAMTALIWAKSFPQFLIGSSLIAFLNVSLGYFVSVQADLTIAGSCAVVSLFMVLLSLQMKR